MVCSATFDSSVILLGFGCPRRDSPVGFNLQSLGPLVLLSGYNTLASILHDARMLRNRAYLR